MGSVELILGLLATAVALALGADRLRLPYPIVLVIGGVALAAAPACRTSSCRPSSSS